MPMSEYIVAICFYGIDLIILSLLSSIHSYCSVRKTDCTDTRHHVTALLVFPVARTRSLPELLFCLSFFLSFCLSRLPLLRHPALHLATTL